MSDKIKRIWQRLGAGSRTHASGTPVTLEQAMLIEYARWGNIPASFFLDRLSDDPALMRAYLNSGGQKVVDPLACSLEKY